MPVTFIDQARSGRTLTPVWLAIPASVLILIASIISGNLFFKAVIIESFGTVSEIQASQFTAGLVQMLRECSELGPAILAVWCIVRFYEGRELSSLGLFPARVVRQLTIGAASGFSLMALWGLVAFTLGGVVIEESRPTVDGFGFGFLFVFFGIMIQTSAEELIFRGWLFQILSNKWGYYVAATVTSLVFAAPHAINDDITPLALLNILLLSFLFCQIVWYQQSLWTLIGFHWFYNWTQFSVLGLDVTPEENLGGAIINLAYTNQVPFITRGFVAEDGLLMTLLALLAIAFLAKLMAEEVRA